MATQYKVDLLEESRRTAYTIDGAIAKRVAKGWSIHSWTVLRHEFVPDGSNHGHGGSYEIVASVLWARETPTPAKGP